MFTRIGRATVLGAVLSAVIGVGIVSAHEHRDVGEYSMTVGFIGEPVFVGQKSGLEFMIEDHETEEPIEGLEESLEAQVTFGDQTRELPLSPRFGAPGWYQSVFLPTAAGPYTFRIHGTIEGAEIDESFTSGPDTFNEVQDTAGGQFPVVYPGTADLARDAEAGAAASTTATIALVLGGAGLLAGLVALGLGLARRRA